MVHVRKVKRELVTFPVISPGLRREVGAKSYSWFSEPGRVTRKSRAVLNGHSAAFSKPGAVFVRRLAFLGVVLVAGPPGVRQAGQDTPSS